MTDATHHHVPDRLTTPLQRTLKSWETLLLAVAIAIFIVNSFASPYFLNAWNLSDATFNFTEKAMIAFAMALVIISGEIDLSVASIIALTSTAMGAAAEVGVNTPGIVLIGLGVGLACGAFNGALVTGLGLPSIVVTIGTMSLFRGISIAGGVGSVAGTLLGALFLGVIKNALPVINISPFWQLAISGSAIIIAVAFNAQQGRTKGRVILKSAEHTA